MAWNATHKAKFKDTNGVFYEIQIVKENYSGAIRSFNVEEEGFKLSYKGKGQAIDKAIHSSELTFTFILQSDEDRDWVLSMLSSPEGEFMVRVFCNPTGSETITTSSRFWNGIIVMNESLLEDIYYPQPYKVRAVDGLELLKGYKITDLTNLKNEFTNSTDTNIKTLDVNGNPEIGYYTFHTLVSRILKLNPISQLYDDTDIADNYTGQRFSWWSDLTDMNPIDAHYNTNEIIIVNSAAFFSSSTQGGGEIRYMNCYDVLEKILSYMNVRIFLQNGAFELIQTSVLYKWSLGENANLAAYDTEGNYLYAAANNENYLLSTFNNIKSETTYNFKRIIKQLNYNINGASDQEPLNVSDLLGGGAAITAQANIPGANAQLGFAQYNDITISGLFPAGNYTSTGIVLSAGQNQTFTCQWSSKLKSFAPPVGTWAGFVNNWSLSVQMFIKLDGSTDYYLTFDPFENKYIWTTTETDINNNVSVDMPYFGQDLYLTQYAGSNFLNNMESPPVDGEIKYYARKVVIAEYYGQSALQTTLSDTGIEGQLQSNSGINGNYGAPSNFPSIAFQVYVNEQAPSFTQYQFTNQLNGTEIPNGEEIEDSVFFIEQFVTTGSTANNKIYIKRTPTSGVSNIINPSTPSWYFRYVTPTEDFVHLPTLKARVVAGLSKNQRVVMNTNLLRKQGSLFYKPWLPSYLMKDDFEGSLRNYMFLGGVFTANSTEFVGEWYRFSFTGVLGNNQLSSGGPWTVGNPGNEDLSNNNQLGNNFF